MEKTQFVIYWFCRVGLGLSWFVAGIIKAISPESFQQEVLAYQIVNFQLAYLVANFLPALEIVLGINLLLGFRKKIGVLISSVLLFGFIVLLSYTWILGLDINCGCYGDIDFVKGQPAAILRDVLLLILGIIVWPRKTS